MIKIGLTGGIGSGKSTVAQLFKTMGVPVFNADMEAKKLMEIDTNLINALKKAFGENVYINQKLNRKYLADIVFNDAYQLEVLNSITHPATIVAAKNWMKQLNTPYCIKEAALLFEAGSGDGLDYIIGVFAPRHLRIHRVMQRDNSSRQDVIARMDKQIDETIKMKLCDFVLVNDETQLLIPQVVSLHQQLLALNK